MEYENALNFLLFSYFGFEDGVDGIKNGNDKIPYLCARRAYLDLARTVKYKYSSSVLDNMSAKKSRDEDKKEAAAFKTAKNDMIDKICQKMLYPVEEKHCCDNEFADWHEKKCKDIKDNMNQATYKSNESVNCIIKDNTDRKAAKTGITEREVIKIAPEHLENGAPARDMAVYSSILGRFGAL